MRIGFIAGTILVALALSKTEKVLRAKTLGSAVKLLRDNLGLSQEGLADEISCGLDATMVSRWERGFCSPSPVWRKRLTAFARRRGCLDLAAVFEEPLHEWRSVVLSEEDRRLLALFEIILINKPHVPDEWPPVLPWKTYERLVQAIEAAFECLKKSHGHRFLGLRCRWGVSLLTEEHAAVWLRETDRRKSKTPVSPSVHSNDMYDMVIRYTDGRVEVVKSEARKETKSGRAKG